MKVKTLKGWIEDAFRMLGIEASATPLNDSQKARMLALLNLELPTVWESEWWPDLMLVEERTLEAGPTLPLAQSGQNEIGGLDIDQHLTEDDPRYNPATPKVGGVTLNGETLYFGDGDIEAGDKVWVKFRPPAPTFTLTAWSGETAYAVGDLSYNGTTGHCYKSIKAGTNHATTDTEYWVVVGIPQLFYQYLLLRCSAARMTEAEGRGPQFNRAREELERIQGTAIDAQTRGPRVARVRM